MNEKDYNGILDELIKSMKSAIKLIKFYKERSDELDDLRKEIKELKEIEYNFLLPKDEIKNNKKELNYFS